MSKFSAILMYSLIFVVCGLDLILNGVLLDLYFCWGNRHLKKRKFCDGKKKLVPLFQMCLSDDTGKEVTNDFNNVFHWWWCCACFSAHRDSAVVFPFGTELMGRRTGSPCFSVGWWFVVVRVDRWQTLRETPWSYVFLLFFNFKDFTFLYVCMPQFYYFVCIFFIVLPVSHMFLK